jgi:hypothetical protein
VSASSGGNCESATQCRVRPSGFPVREGSR